MNEISKKIKENLVIFEEFGDSNNKYAYLIKEAISNNDIILPNWIMEMDGMSGKKYRDFINKLIKSLKDPRYLEIGCWKGSTSCAAIYNNDITSYCIDNWSEFGGPKNIFTENIQRCVYECDKIEIVFEEGDFRKIDYSKIGKYNVYLFDGPHEERDQYDGLVLVQPALDNEFIFICDDWNWEQVRNGTKNAIKESNIDVVFSIEIRTTNDNSYPPEENTMEKSDWHNGYYISVLSKN